MRNKVFPKLRFPQKTNKAKQSECNIHSNNLNMTYRSVGLSANTTNSNTNINMNFSSIRNSRKAIMNNLNSGMSQPRIIRSKTAHRTINFLFKLIKTAIKIMICSYKGPIGNLREAIKRVQTKTIKINNKEYKIMIKILSLKNKKLP